MPPTPTPLTAAIAPRDEHAAAQHAAVERWVRRRLGTTGHERRVAEISATVFELTSPLHALRPCRDGRLLRLAALVHDVGRCVDDAEHPAHGAAMLLSDESLPLGAAERRALAYLTLYHRGSVPALGDDDVLHPEDDREGLLTVLGMLRCADGLDSRSLESPRLVFALLEGSRSRRATLRVTCYLHSDSEKARRVYQRPKKFRLLEQTLGCSVEVDVASAQALRMVA
jgi:exopolyphosphatase/pppGpp-phosphohydrolase